MERSAIVVADQRSEHMVAENSNLGAKSHQKEDVENRPDAENIKKIE
jgi:hypothetical protein